MDAAAILNSQYQASLEMLKQTIIACPQELWNADNARNRFWHTAYHALFFTHLYVEESEEAFRPWSKHRTGYEDFDGGQDFEPYEKEELLEYLAFCQQHVAERVPQLDLEALEGFGDRTLITLELQLYSIRHLMQHVGELMDRLSTQTGTEIEWVGWVHTKKA